MPFIVTAYQPKSEVDYYQLQLDGQTIKVDPEFNPDPGDQVRMKYDVTNVSSGNHTAAVSACNVWGCSPFSDPFLFTKVLPGIPSGIGLEA